MKEYKYLITDGYERFIFEKTKEKAEETALASLEHTEDINFIYKIECIGESYYPETPIVKWD